MTSTKGFRAERFLTEVLGATDVEQRGDELVHPCLLPWGNHEHDHTSPGASLNTEKLLWNCFKCNSGGTLLWVTQEVLGVDSAKARELIKGNFALDSMSREQFLNELEDSYRKDSSGMMPRYDLKMLKPWLCYTEFMDGRGISRQVQKEMMTGLRPDNKDDIGGTWVVQPRIIIPHIFGGKLRGWSARLVNEKVQLGMKYKHSSDFPKRYTLYNWDNVARDEIILVESPMSVLKLKSLGVPNVLATFGAEVNQEQIDLLGRHFSSVVLFPDGDRPGYRALRAVDRRGNEDGVIPRLLRQTNVYVVDHGRLPCPPGCEVHTVSEDHWNEKDAGNYTREKISALLDAKVSASLWRWRDEWRDDGVRKADKNKNRRMVSKPAEYYD